MTNSPTFTLYTDGGARGNPGPAAIGIVILDNTGAVVREFSSYIGTATNNEAEYNALIKGLELIALYWKGAVKCISDSELLVRHLTGVYAVRSSNIKPLFTKVKSMLNTFQTVSFVHVNRDNAWITRCDALVNEVLDKLEKKR